MAGLDPLQVSAVVGPDSFQDSSNGWAPMQVPAMVGLHAMQVPAMAGLHSL